MQPAPNLSEHLVNTWTILLTPMLLLEQSTAPHCDLSERFETSLSTPMAALPKRRCTSTSLSRELSSRGLQTRQTPPRCYLQPMTNIVTTQSNNSWNLSPHVVDQIRSIPKTPTTSVDDTGIPTVEEIMTEFPSMFDGQIRTMPGEKFHISLMADARPFCVTTPRTVPFAYRDKLQSEIDLLVSQGIIAPVTEPTEWCAPIVVTPKKNSDRIRMCVDLSKLNRFVLRERYPSTTPAEAVADIAQSKAKYFTVFDALKGYHQCPLDEESQKLTTFITPLGRFKYLRATYGISEHHNRRMDEAFAGLSDFRKIVDNVVVFDSDPKKHVQHVRQLLRHCEEKKISLNREKFQFCQSSAHFAGFTLTPHGYSISNDICDAIAQFPTPSSRTDLRSFFGLVNQLASSTKHITEVLAPLRPVQNHMTKPSRRPKRH